MIRLADTTRLLIGSAESSFIRALLMHEWLQTRSAWPIIPVENAVLPECIGEIDIFLILVGKFSCSRPDFGNSTDIENVYESQKMMQRSIDVEILIIINSARRLVARLINRFVTLFAINSMKTVAECWISWAIFLTYFLELSCHAI